VIVLARDAAMQIAGHNVDPSDVIAAVAVLVSLFFYRQNRGIAADSKSMAEANKTMAETNMSMADSAKLSAQAALDAVEFQRKADLLARKACLRLAREHGSEGLTWFHVDLPPFCGPLILRVRSTPVA
jgi:hypothetical protein